MTALISVQEAQSRILSVFTPLASEIVPLQNAYWRVLAEDTHTGFDFPPFDNSSVDGFALNIESRPENIPPDGVYAIQGDIPAGTQSSIPVQPGQAYRIMTGAPLPLGANAIVPVENTDFPYRQPDIPLPATVKVLQIPQPGENIRSKGQDVSAGALLLPRGRRLLPQDIGILATAGLAAVPVVKQPRVALFSSGDELVAPGEDRSPGKIFDANSHTLANLAQSEGAVLLPLGVVSDDINAVRTVLQNAIDAGVDFILSSAGVSVGAYDYVRRVIEESGTLTLWRVNMRPGKPLAFGIINGIPVISLPGNPVSAFVSYLVFVRPVIRFLSGMNNLQPPSVRVQLEHPIESDGRESYLRAIIRPTDTGYSARLTGHQGSGNLFSLVLANALLIIPAGVKSLPAGEWVEAWLLETP